MRRTARFAGCLLVGMFSLTTLSAGSAVAASSPTPGAALHAFGAEPPTGRATSAVSAVSARSAALSVLPASVDLRKWAVTPGNQGALNSCVPWVIDYALLGWYSRFSGLVGQPFAPMYAYSQINRDGDNGSYATAALDLVVAQGNDTRAHYTKGDTNWQIQPTAAQRASAARFKIKGYTTLFAGSDQAANSALLKEALATNHPVAIGMWVRHGFDYLATGPTAVDDDVTTPVLGYHEVLAVGYDTAGLIVQNSWGTGWASNGFGRISWRVVQRDVGDANIISGFTQAVTAPTISALSVSHPVEAVHTGPTTRYKAIWKGVAGNSGAITQYDFWAQVDGGPYVSVKLATPMATSFVISARVGHTYRVAVRARAGIRIGAARYGGGFLARH